MLAVAEAGGVGAESVSKKELRRKRATSGINILVVVVVGGGVDDALFPRDLHAATGASSFVFLSLHAMFLVYVRFVYRRVTEVNHCY
jgi:hypothetical protein